MNSIINNMFYRNNIPRFSISTNQCSKNDLPQLCNFIYKSYPNTYAVTKLTKIGIGYKVSIVTMNREEEKEFHTFEVPLLT